MSLFADDADAVARLRARTAIRWLCAQYARGLDTRSADLLASCYSPEAVHDHGRFRGGRQEFARWALDAATQHFSSTLHTFQHNVITLLGDGHAIAETYGEACHRDESTADHALDNVVTVRYCDRLTCEDGRWRFLARTTVYERSRIDPIPPDLAHPVVRSSGRYQVESPPNPSEADLLATAMAEGYILQMGDRDSRQTRLIHHTCPIELQDDRLVLEAYSTTTGVRETEAGSGTLTLTWERSISTFERLVDDSWRMYEEVSDIQWTRTEQVDILHLHPRPCDVERAAPLPAIGLRELAAVDDAGQVLGAVTRATDRRDAPLLEALLTPGFRFTLRERTEDAAAYIEQMLRLGTSTHALHRSLPMAVDATNIQLRTLCTVTRRAPASAGIADEISLVRYDDVLAYHEGRWLLASRDETELWRVCRPIRQTRPAPGPDYAIASPDEQDPVYRLLDLGRGPNDHYAR